MISIKPTLHYIDININIIISIKPTIHYGLITKSNATHEISMLSLPAIMSGIFPNPSTVDDDDINVVNEICNN